MRLSSRRFARVEDLSDVRLPALNVFENEDDCRRALGVPNMPSGRLLLRQAVQRAEPQHQIHRVDPHYRTVRE